MNIWCVEDDENINNLITYALESQGFNPIGFTCFKDMEKAMTTQKADLILLDVMLPDTDGITILKWLKASKEHKNIPVVMLTAKNSEIDIVKALDLGAEDYITKPFGVLEMVSRVKAVLRRCDKTEVSEDILTFEDIKLYTQKHQVKILEEKIELTLKEYSVLKLLMQYPQRVFTRENIMDSVWGDSYVGESRTVDMHIKTLRQKLGDCGKYIITIRGVGYRLEDESRNS